MILPVITIGHETLKRRAFEVAVISDAKIQTLIDDMIPTMFEKDGIGLAANQVNALHRIAVIVPDPHRFDAYKEAERGVGRDQPRDHQALTPQGNRGGGLSLSSRRDGTREALEVGYGYLS